MIINVFIKNTILQLYKLSLFMLVLSKVFIKHYLKNLSTKTMFFNKSVVIYTCYT